MIDVSFWTAWAELIVAVSAAAGFVFTAVGFGVRWMFSTFKRLDRLQKIVEEIRDEMKPNGGGSMRDAVDRTAKDVNTLKRDHLQIAARQWAMVAGARDPVIEFNAAGECTRANRAFLQLADRDLTEVTGNGWANAVDPADRERVLVDWNQAVKYRRAFEGSFKLRPPEGGAAFSVKCNATPVTTDQGDLVGYMGRLDSVVAL